MRIVYNYASLCVSLFNLYISDEMGSRQALDQLSRQINGLISDSESHSNTLSNEDIITELEVSKYTYIYLYIYIYIYIYLNLCLNL